MMYNWLQHFAPEELEREFMGSGFTLKGLYSDVAGNTFDKKSSEFSVVTESVLSVTLTKQADQLTYHYVALGWYGITLVGKQ